jgi:hypothetical protein
MNLPTKIVLSAVASVTIFAIAISDTSPRRMAEVDVNTCFRSLPSATDIFAVAQRHRALERCNAMKELYVKTYKVPYNNY